MADEIEVIYRIRMDREKLDAYVTGLYDGPPDDPCPEPPGLSMARDWAAEARGYIAAGHGADTVWWCDDYTVGIVIEVHERPGK